MNKAPDQPAPADGIKVIEYSLRCFSFSLWSLIPLLGLPFVLMAFSNYRKARAVSQGHWNPARSLLAWGSALSSLGLLISTLVVMAIIASFLKMLPGQY
jgi:hypothetical protein